MAKMTKAAITEVTHDRLEGEELAPPSSACAGLSTTALPNAAGAVGLAEGGFVKKVLPTKVLSSMNVEFEGDLVRGMEGESDDTFVAGRMWSSSMYNSSGISKGATSAASAGSPGTISMSRAGSRRCRNTRQDPI